MKVLTLVELAEHYRDNLLNIIKLYLFPLLSSPIVCTCVCVCVYVCNDVCVGVCMCVYVCVCIIMCMYCMCVYIYVTLSHLTSKAQTVLHN